jgi:hypothetical protein
MKNCRRILNGAMAVVLLCVTSSCIWLLPQGDGSGSFSRGHEDEKYNEWCNELPRYIIPRICAYYQLHPERFKRTGQDEEVEILEFDKFVKNDAYFKNGHRSSAWSGKIKDPWGKPLHFVEDLNIDGYIEAAGERQEVWKEGVIGKVEFTNQEHHFGILKQSPFKGLGPYGNASRIFAITYYETRP